MCQILSGLNCVLAILPLLFTASNAQNATSLPTPSELLQQAETAMGGREALAKVTSISAIASCQGPKFAYEMRLVSDRAGNISFQQFLPDRRNIEGIRDGRGWLQNADGTYQWMDPVEVSVVRGHDFPMMLTDLVKRFSDLKTIGRVQYQGQSAFQVALTDDLGHRGTIYFSVASHLPVALEVTNPRAPTPPTITDHFDAWKSVNGVKLVSHVTVQYGSDTCVFDFKTLTLNTATDDSFKIPEPLIKSGSSR